MLVMNSSWTGWIVSFWIKFLKVWDPGETDTNRTWGYCQVLQIVPELQGCGYC